MAIVPMKRVSVYGLKKDRKAVLEALQRYGDFEVIDEKNENAEFMRMDTAPYQGTFMKAAAAGEQALAILNSYVSEGGSMLDSLKGRKVISPELYYKYVGKADEIMRFAKRVISLDKTIAEQKAEIVKAELAKESLIPWLSLDVPINFKGTKKTAAFIGTFPAGTSRDDILQGFAAGCAERNIDVPIELPFINEGQQQTAAMLLCLKENKDAAEEILREMEFAYPSITAASEPKTKSAELDRQIENAKGAISEAESELVSYSEKRDSFKFLSDYYTMRLEKYKVLSKVENLKRTFFVSGYVPERDARDLEAVLVNKYNAAVEICDVKDDESVPVLLKNNKFSEPVESIVESYSMPGKGEIDPTGVMSLFYYFMFGLMLGDFAYGLLMVIGCGAALLKFKGMEEGMRKTLKMFLYCGISTAFWGLMFGSCFGDAVTVIGKTFFGVDIAFSPLWFEPINKPIQMLMFSFGVGIIHLFVGLFMKLYLCIKHGHIKDAVYDVVFWYMLVGGGIVFLFSVDMFVNMTGLGFKVGPLGAEIAKWCALIGAAGIVLTNGRSSKNPVKRFVKGLYELYNVTGYLSDILSYSRLLALGLATGVIAQVFNKIGSMGGNSFFGVILFIAVFLIGHTVNLGINLLGAYVHTNRLQFVEFFGKFYEGGGRKYEPFSSHTKYYKIKEDI